MTTVEILEKAKKLVEKGWGQGSDVEADGRNCVVTALWTVNQDPAMYVRAKDAIRAALGVNGMLVIWNDAPGRTQAEVVAAFTKAIELAKAQP